MASYSNPSKLNLIFVMKNNILYFLIRSPLNTIFNQILKYYQNLHSSTMSAVSAESLRNSVTNIRYFTCPKGHLHEGEALNRICVHKQCLNQGLICVICEEQEHKNHHTLPVKQFLNILIGDNKNIFEGSLKSLISVQQARSSVNELINMKRKQIQQQFNKLQTDVTRYFDQIDQLAKNLFHTEGPIQKIVEELIYGSEQNLPNIMKKIKTVLGIVDIGDQKQFSIQNILNELVNDASQKELKISQNLTKLVNDASKTMQLLSSFLSETLTFGDSTMSYKWSDKMKGAKISINGNIAEQTGMQSSGQRFILMQQDLSKNNKKKVWGIKIKKFGGWIGIGISLKSQIVGANFNFHYTTIGHGSYLISTNGYSWSHSLKQFNSTFKCFTFAVGDTIYIEYNPLSGKLKFRKNQSVETKDQFQLDIVAAPKGDAYHPSANLCSTNDSVQVIYPVKFIS